MVTTKLLDEDSYYITSWEDVCKEAIQDGRVEEFRKKICDFIQITNKPYENELIAYRDRRLAEESHEKLMDKIRKKRQTKGKE